MLCLKAHAKINWTLDILGTRPDGYHLMEMLMQCVDLHDTLWLEQADDLRLENATNNEAAHLQTTGTDELASQAVTYDENNLVYRAARTLQAYCGISMGAHMRLLKRIPSGAGMGGGSADAAAALKGLNALWNLKLSDQELLNIGLSIGADVPFLLTGGLAHVGGIGEVISPLLPAPEVWLVLIQPCSGLSTREVFGAFDALDPTSLRRPDTPSAQQALLSADLPSLGRSMENVLEHVSIQARPAIAQAARQLEALGAVRAMMTGSGSVVYGIFATQQDAQAAAEAFRPVAVQNGWGDVWVTHTLS